MALYYHKLSTEKYANFLSEGRYDSITKERFKEGDKVAICSHCKSASLLGVWTAFEKKHCNQSDSELYLEGNRGKKYAKFTIDFEPDGKLGSEVSHPILQGIGHILKAILIVFPLFILNLILDLIVGIFSFLRRILKWLIIFILYFILYSIGVLIVTLIIESIFHLNYDQMGTAIIIGALIAVLNAIRATNERF